MVEGGPRTRRPASRLLKVGEGLWAFGLFALFIAPVVLLPSALARGSWPEINRAAAISFGLPGVLLLGAFLLTRFAVWRENRRA